MSAGLVLTVGVPAAFWKEDAVFTPAVTEALQIEDRLRDRVNLERERTRYSQCCLRLEQIALRHHGDVSANGDLADSDGFPTIKLTEVYLPALGDALNKHQAAPEVIAGRCGSSFWTPQQLSRHVDGFKFLLRDSSFTQLLDARRRLGFIEEALSSGDGIVEIVAPFLGTSQPSFENGDVSQERTFASDSVPDFLKDSTESVGLREADRLRAAIEHALSDGVPVNVSNYRNSIITQVLHEFVFANRSNHAAVPIIYQDGSRGPDFPLPTGLHVDSAHTPQDAAVLRLALVGMRHPEMDHLIDAAWYRNVEASQAKSHGEIDASCYELSRVRLRELRGEDVVIEMLQTGLEPAVVSFYRALVQELVERKATRTVGILQVVPMFHVRGHDYRRGPTWG